MDKNKTAELLDIGYVVKRCCGNCDNADLYPGRLWGTCRVHSYAHLKHVGPERQLSINCWGYCDKYTPFDELTMQLGGFADFLEYPCK